MRSIGIGLGRRRDATDVEARCDRDAERSSDSPNYRNENAPLDHRCYDDTWFAVV